MNVDEKLTLLHAVEQSGFEVKKALKALDLSCSTYYSWKNKFKNEGARGLLDKRPIPKRQWNSLLDDEQEKVLEIANLHPDLSSREIAVYITDKEIFSVSESSVYRVLKRNGLIREQIVESFPAAKEYSYKPSKVNEQWQTDATYLFVQGWGWFYLISVLDDYSRKILAWDLMKSNTGDDFVEVIKQSCINAKVDPEDMPKLVSDRGPALISADLNEYLDDHDIYHIYAAPYHPQTNGKIERWHKSLKSKIYLHQYETSDELKVELELFINYYNQERYHESLNNVTPDDVFYGRREGILKLREEKKTLTLKRRKEINCMYNKVSKC